MNSASPPEPSPQEREAALFEMALEKTGAEREAFLRRVCSEDPALHARVKALLTAAEEEGDLLTVPARPARRSGESHAQGTSPDEAVGQAIGRYKLLEKVGEGGCGVVYVAGQVEPVRRRVALKVIKLGMDTKAVVARFEAERQALAMMDHPNIAKVFDGGTTEKGRPYFVMELVRGIKITDYCDQNKLPTRERLILFVQVCHAIQHAHQKGIIHRDIKPSNILVTLQDGIAVPKVIDFGVAKATAGRLTEATVYTQLHQLVGTPAYMSPEQVEMTSVDVDTRSDIYSLGVLLYELLTGRTPFDTQELMSEGIDVLRRTIRETEPLRPSTRLATLKQDELTTTAQRRATEAPRLISLLKGDLDWVVMKCLEKDRTRRYDTANGLAMDVHRYLADEPVVARPPSRLYRLQKSVRRNKLLFTAAGAVAAALVVGLGLSTWLLFKERAAEQVQSQLRQQAQSEARKSAEVAGFFKKMLGAVGPSVALGRDTAMLREILDTTAREVGDNLKGEPETEAELRSIIGDVYWSLGQYTNAETMHRSALTLRRGLWGNMNTNVAQSLDGVARALQGQERFDDVEPLLLESLAIRTNLLGLDHLDVGTSWWVLGEQRSLQNRLTEAEELFRRSLALRRKFLGDEHPEVADVLSRLTRVLYRRGKLVEAESVGREALAIRGGANVFDDEGTAVVLGAALRFQRKMDESEPILRQALEVRRKVLGPNHPLLCGTLLQLSLLLHAKGELEEAERLARQSLELVHGTQLRFMHAVSLEVLGQVLRKGGRLAEAEMTLRQSLEVWEQGSVVTRDETIARDELADLLRQQGKPEAIEALYRDGVGVQRKIATQAARQRETRLLTSLADFLRSRAKPAEAEASFREALAVGNSSGSVDELALAMVRYGDLLLSQRRMAEAESLCRQGLALCSERGPNDFMLYEWLTSGLATALRAQGTSAEADAMVYEDVALGRKFGVSEGLANALGHLGDLHRDQGRPVEAEAAYREGLDILRIFSRQGSESWVWQTWGLAAALTAQANIAAAEPLFRESLDWARKSGSSNNMAQVLADFGHLLCDQGRVTEAEPLFREGLDICRKAWPENSELRCSLATGLANVLTAGGRWREAEMLMSEDVALSRKFGPSPGLADGLAHLGHFLYDQGRITEAEPLFREGLDICRKVCPEKSELRRRLATGWAKVMSAGGRWEEAKILMSEDVALSRRFGPSGGLAAGLAHLGDLLRDHGRFPEAEPLYREGLDICRKVCPQNGSLRKWLAVGLGLGFRAQGKLADAEDFYREAVTNSVKTWPKDSSKWEWQLTDLANLLVRQRKASEVTTLYDRLSAIAPLPKQAQAAIWVGTGDAYACQRELHQAIPFYTKAIQLAPTNQLSYLRLASALAAIGDTNGCADLCRQILNQFAASTDPLTCANAAKACLMRPCSGADLLTVSNWARIAVTVPGPDRLRPWAEFLIGHVEYRLAHFAEAVRWEQKVVSEINPTSARDVQTQCVLAMAQHQLRHTAEARTALAKAAEIARTKLSPPESGDLGESWWDYLLAHLLLREAQALIGPEAPPQPDSPQ